MISYSFTGCLLSDLLDLQFLHGVAGNDDREPCLVAEEESEEPFLTETLRQATIPPFFGFLLTLICNVCFMALTSLSGRDVVLSFRC